MRTEEEKRESRELKEAIKDCKKREQYFLERDKKEEKKTREQSIERLSRIFGFCSQKLTGQEIKREIAGVLDYGKGGKE